MLLVGQYLMLTMPYQSTRYGADVPFSAVRLAALRAPRPDPML